MGCSPGPTMGMGPKRDVYFNILVMNHKFCKPCINSLERKNAKCTHNNHDFGRKYVKSYDGVPFIKLSQVSISSTFYARLLCTKVLSLISVWLCIFFGEKILSKNLLVKCKWNWLQGRRAPYCLKTALLKSEAEPGQESLRGRPRRWRENLFRRSGLRHAWAAGTARDRWRLGRRGSLATAPRRGTCLLSSTPWWMS